MENQKREYSKPTIHVEVMCMDMPVASACQSYGESPELQAQGWFAGNSGTCSFFFDDSNYNGGILSEMGDAICYHSHVKTTLTS